MISLRQSKTTDVPVASLLTPRGRGAIATVRLEGPAALLDEPNRSSTGALPLFRAVNGRPLAEQTIGRIVFGHWGGPVSEEVVICRVGERSTEIHCHGGEAAARRILNDLESVGCTVQSWQEALGQTTPLLEAECTAALTRATTLRTAEILLEQQAGLLRGAIENGTEQQLDALLQWAGFGLHLSRPWRVVLAGRPNVGKSSIINALIGYSRSIVFDQPGTTRDVVTAETALDGWPIQFADTAGIRTTLTPGPSPRRREANGGSDPEAHDDLESAGIELTRKILREADCRVLLLDTSRPPHEDDRQLLADCPDALLVAHKCDLPNVWGDQLPPEALPVSSLTGHGVDELARSVVNRLVPEVPPAGTPIPVTPRQVELLQEARDALRRGEETACRDALQRLLGSPNDPS